MNKFEVETLTFQKPRPTSCPSFNIKKGWGTQSFTFCGLANFLECVRKWPKVIRVAAV